MLRYLLIFASLLIVSACGGGSTPPANTSAPQSAPSMIEEPKAEEKTPELSEEGKVQFTQGETLFNTHCTACHKLEEDVVGPALANVHERHSLEWIKKFVRNSKKMIAEGDKEAVAIYEKYNKTEMLQFENLSDEEIENIIFYITEKSKTL